MEEDGINSTLKVLEGTVSFKPNNGEEIILTGGQMVSATEGIAGEISEFSIDGELSDWSDKTQVIFKQILEEAEQNKEDSPASQEEQQSQQSPTEVSEILENTEERDGIFPIMLIVIALLLIGGIFLVFVISKKKSKATVAPTYRTAIQPDGRQSPRYCPSCGSPLGEKSKFCGRCGQRLS